MTSQVTSAELVPIRDLTRRQRALWRGLQLANPALASPYFSLEFASCMAGRRSDSQALVINSHGRTTGFLPMQLGWSGIARPLGGPLGDHHGLISEDDDLDIAAALAMSGVPVFTFDGALASQASFGTLGAGIEPSWVVDLSAGHDAWLENRRIDDAKAMRNIRARQRKLAESGLDIVYRIDDRRPEAMAETFALKRAQYSRTGAFDVFMAGWARDLMSDLFAQQSDALRGCLSTLEIDGKLAAAHFGMRSQSVLHYWFPVFWPEHANLGPGLQLFLEIGRQLAPTGLDAIHLGPGDFDFKRKLANTSFAVATGRIEQPSLVSSVLKLGETTDRMAQQLPLGRAAAWPGKAMRRLGTLASTYCL